MELDMELDESSSAASADKGSFSPQVLLPLFSLNSKATEIL